MHYKVELRRDLDPFYPEIKLVLWGHYFLGKHKIAYVSFLDKGLIPEAYSMQEFRHKEDAIKVYNDYIAEGEVNNG